MSQRPIALQPFKSDFNFYCHTYWEAPVGYYSCRRRVTLASCFRTWSGCTSHGFMWS
jgi:hypothetical protein